MEFNINWTKEDNDKMRQFIKERKGESFIRNYFTNDKLFYHPSKKYYIPNGSWSLPIFLLNNIKRLEDSSKDVDYIEYERFKNSFTFDFNKSTSFIDKFDYYYDFHTSSHKKCTLYFTYKDEQTYTMELKCDKELETSEYKEVSKRMDHIVEHFRDKFGGDCDCFMIENKL